MLNVPNYLLFFEPDFNGDCFFFPSCVRRTAKYTDPPIAASLPAPVPLTHSRVNWCVCNRDSADTRGHLAGSLFSSLTCSSCPKKPTKKNNPCGELRAPRHRAAAARPQTHTHTHLKKKGKKHAQVKNRLFIFVLRGCFCIYVSGRTQQEVFGTPPELGA